MDDQSDDNAFDKEEWMSAASAFERAVKVLGRSQTPLTIVKRAYVGLIRTRAVRFIKGEEEYRNVDLPIEFWWAKGHTALVQDWDSGDFGTWVGKEHHKKNWEAFGVTFNRKDVEKMLNGAEALEVATVKLEQKDKQRSSRWDAWIAEIVFYYADQDFPSGTGSDAQEFIIQEIDKRLRARGHEKPLARSTVQSAVQAALDRAREPKPAKK